MFCLYDNFSTHNSVPSGFFVFELFGFAGIGVDAIPGQQDLLLLHQDANNTLVILGQLDVLGIGEVNARLLCL